MQLYIKKNPGKRGEEVDKKLTKSDVGEWLTAKKCNAGHSKNDILRVTVFLNDP